MAKNTPKTRGSTHARVAASRRPLTQVRELGSQGSALYRAMVAAGHDARMLANMIPVHETTVGKWFRGSRPQRHHAQRLIEIYDTLTMAVFGYDD